MFREKSIRFQGSKERLHRMVERYAGEFLENQEFTLLWQDTHYQKMHRMTFRFHCRCKREAEGYRITYRIRPVLFSGLRLLLRLGFWSWAICFLWDPAEPTAAFAAMLLTAVMLITDYWQMRACEREFVRRFTAATRRDSR